MPTTLYVCVTCSYSAEAKTGPDGRTGGEMLADAVEARAAGEAGVEVIRHACLMGCEHPCNAAMTAPGKLTYVLGRFAPDEGAADALVEYAGKHAASETGQVPFREWPAGVKGKFVARIPALGAPAGVVPAAAVPALGD